MHLVEYSEEPVQKGPVDSSRYGAATVRESVFTQTADLKVLQV